MITVKEIDKSFLELYDKVAMNVDVQSEYHVKRINNGLGGLILEEVKVKPYIKDLSIYERAAEYEKEFDITNWRFYMAFDGNTPVGAMTIVGKTDGLNMLYGREDACVLWDIRIADAYKHNGIGQKLLDMGVSNAKKDGYQQMIIECQNNNVPACKFYQKQGAVLSKIDMYAYYLEPELDTVDNSQINVLTQRTMHRICTAATNEEVSFAYRVAIPRQRFRWRNAFSTRWRSL